MSEKSWIHDFFGGESFGDDEDLYGRAYTAMGIFGMKDANKEVDGVINILKPEPGSHILDWCGGWGRHSIPLAKRGFKVSVLDFSKGYLDKAQREAEFEGVVLDLVHADFRQTPPEIQADYAVNLFTAGLGYLGEENDIIALNSLRAALKPGAKILIDTMSLFWIVRNFSTTSHWQSDDGTQRYDQVRSFGFWKNTEYSQKTFKDYWPPGFTKSCLTELKFYSPADLARVLKVVGFVPQGLFGDYDGSEFTLDSKRIIMTAQKP